MLLSCQMVDEPRATDQDQSEDEDQDEVPSNTDVHSSPLSSWSPSPPPPNRIPDPDEVDSADPPPLSNLLQAGDDEGSNEMENVWNTPIRTTTRARRMSLGRLAKTKSLPIQRLTRVRCRPCLRRRQAQRCHRSFLKGSIQWFCLPPERDSSPLSSLGPPSFPADLRNDNDI
ncbi:hypothetical protein B0H12DRAFT_730693 [Mycena haematopus]|nr:hypothetical protein B0H12DRAFT_730693 [Mycena haematopus]